MATIERRLVKIELSVDDLLIVRTALTEYKHQLLQSHIAPKDRTEPTPGRLLQIDNVKSVQKKLA